MMTQFLPKSFSRISSLLAEAMSVVYEHDELLHTKKTNKIGRGWTPVSLMQVSSNVSLKNQPRFGWVSLGAALFEGPWLLVVSRCFIKGVMSVV